MKQNTQGNKLLPQKKTTKNFSRFHSSLSFAASFGTNVMFFCLFILSFSRLFLRFVFIHQNTNAKHTYIQLLITSKLNKKIITTKIKKQTHKSRHQILCIQLLLHILKTHWNIHAIHFHFHLLHNKNIKPVFFHII